MLTCESMIGSRSIIVEGATVGEGSTVGAGVILSGSISRKVNLKGIGATKGAKAAIEAAGGAVAE